MQSRVTTINTVTGTHGILNQEIKRRSITIASALISRRIIDQRRLSVTFLMVKASFKSLPPRSVKPQDVWRPSRERFTGTDMMETTETSASQR